MIGKAGMGNRRTTHRWGGFDVASLLAMAAFFSTVPLLLLPLNMMYSMLLGVGSEPVLMPLGSSPFLLATALSAMFTALAMLFVCLLKTAYARIGRLLLIAAGAAYLAGMGVVCVAHFVPGMPSSVVTIAGAPLGFGTAVLCMAWARQVKLRDFSMAFAALTALGIVVGLIDTILFKLGGAAVPIGFFLLSVVGVLGCLRFALSSENVVGKATASGSNWWDVFGRLDLSLLESGNAFTTPLSRLMFFIATPAVVFLLFITGMNMHHSLYGGIPIELAGGGLAFVCALPLLLVRTEKGMINAAYRFYLPFIAIIVFVAGDFASSDVRGLLLNVGVYAFCFVYGLLMCAMVVTMLSRMKSLALPAACMLVIAASLIAVLSYANIEAGSLSEFKLNVLLVLLAVVVVLLIAMPSSRIWRIVLQGVDAIDSAVPDKMHDAAPLSEEQLMEVAPVADTIEQRCDRAAKEYGLTPRETEILRYLGRGYSSVYIAEEFVIAESTVRSHVKSIYRKMDVSSRTELFSRIDEMD